jgi:hypothetical protein
MISTTNVLKNIHRKSLSSLSDIRINNLQSLEIPTSKEVISKYKANVIKNEDFNSSFDYSNENKKETVFIENNKRPMIFSPSFTVDLKQASLINITPPTSPTLCDESNKKSKKRRSIGVNTEILVNNASGETLNKFTCNLSNLLIILIAIILFL